MKKLVPDPPARALTVHTPFAACDGHHPPLFAVCAGAEVDEALAHLAVMLRSAYETNFQACDAVRDNSLAGLLWATQHTLEAARALAESMLRGIAQKQAQG
ncbi:hypothetical protein [Pseudomonas japonica]|uniref:DUF3077 domain-containing protein n=1 Tax=Pseudomonas japonica TaxID=256466 RepID=A0A239E4U2_9PSED|nr:hypothetical protein [Pseudomonas japonica]SNS39489.1 hypothetical protein SAMN05444352_10794 [Pseudomonas japonica]